MDLLMLFTSAFDDSFVFRYEGSRNNPKSKINVRYIHGPKQRVIHDIVSKEKNLTLPVVAIEQTGISRDADRVFHKHQNIYRPLVGNKAGLGEMPTPIPVTMGVKVSIIAKYKEDIDQIVQNFITVCNPYFVVSWKVPEDFGFDFVDEVRVQVEWDGNVSYTSPSTLSKEDKYRISGDTTFTIKGWLFPSAENPTGIIHVINYDFINASLEGKIMTYDDYPALSSNYTESDNILLSAYPEFTNLYFTTSGTNLMVDDEITIKSNNSNSFIILGKRFDYQNEWFLSSYNLDLYDNYQEIDTSNFPTISGFKLPESYVNVLSDNTATINLPASSLSASAPFTFVTSNSAGWTSWPLNINSI